MFRLLNRHSRENWKRSPWSVLGLIFPLCGFSVYCCDICSSPFVVHWEIERMIIYLWHNARNLSLGLGESTTLQRLYGSSEYSVQVRSGLPRLIDLWEQDWAPLIYCNNLTTVYSRTLSAFFGFAETPLTLAAHLDNVVEIITALKTGGAHLDFRSRDGMTALHKAVRAKNQIALKVRFKLLCHQ